MMDGTMMMLPRSARPAKSHTPGPASGPSVPLYALSGPIDRGQAAPRHARHTRTRNAYTHTPSRPHAPRRRLCRVSRSRRPSSAGTRARCRRYWRLGLDVEDAERGRGGDWGGRLSCLERGGKVSKGGVRKEAQKGRGPLEVAGRVMQQAALFSTARSQWGAGRCAFNRVGGDLTGKLNERSRKSRPISGQGAFGPATCVVGHSNDDDDDGGGCSGRAPWTRTTAQAHK